MQSLSRPTPLCAFTHAKLHRQCSSSHDRVCLRALKWEEEHIVGGHARKYRVKSGCSSSSSESMVSEEWLKKLPDKKKPLYSHSLPCIEAWLTSMGFYQSKDDPAVWHIQKPDWHAHLSLDIRELYIKYLKSGPGNLERDVERKFSYALSREDLENVILGGP